MQIFNLILYYDMTTNLMVLDGLRASQTSSQSIDIRPLRRRTRAVQSHLPDGANVPLHLIRGSLDAPDSVSQTASIGTAVFGQLKTDSPYSLPWAAIFSLKSTPSLSPSNTRFLGPTPALPSPPHKRHLDRFNRYRDRLTD